MNDECMAMLAGIRKAIGELIRAEFADVPSFKERSRMHAERWGNQPRPYVHSPMDKHLECMRVLREAVIDFLRYDIPFQGATVGNHIFYHKDAARLLVFGLDAFLFVEEPREPFPGDDQFQCERQWLARSLILGDDPTTPYHCNCLHWLHPGYNSPVKAALDAAPALPSDAVPAPE